MWELGRGETKPNAENVLGQSSFYLIPVVMDLKESQKTKKRLYYGPPSNC